MCQHVDPNNPQDGLDDSFDDDLGPNFGSIPNLPGSGGNVGGANSKIDLVKRALHSYEQHSRGYVPFDLYSKL